MSNLQIDIVKQTQIYMFRSQIEENEYSNLTGNIVILSDRLLFLASELYLYMIYKTDTTMLGVISDVNDLKSIPTKNIDYVIIVGYLEKEESYNIINTIRSYSDKVKTIQWALLDAYIKKACLNHNIYFQFDRLKPVSQFVSYLQKIKDQKDYDIISINT